MANVMYTVTIDQPVDKVFSYVTEVSNHLKWQQGILDAKVSPDGPVGLGSIYSYTSEVMGRRMETQLRVSAYEPNKRWSVTTTGVPRPVETAYMFENEGSTTKLTISMELSGGYPAAAEAMVKQQMQKSLEDQGNRIKSAIL
ncbi:MAG TPA: SRPBCC family protein [Aggregatilineales bacterium]|nr:SRPBCC family protein [Aggregatilineales bacterium]